MEITLRPSTEDDKNFCCQVHHLAYRDVVERQFGGWDESKQKAFFEEGWEILQPNLVEVDGVPVGFFCCTAQPDQLSLLEIQLLPIYQGKGIGTELIKRAQCEAARLELPLRLRVLKANRARVLYQRLGFKETGEDVTHYLMEWTGD